MVVPASTTLNIFDHPVLMDKTMRCDKCRRGAVIFQPYSGLHLCEAHFVADFEAKAKRAIRTHHWMKSNDHIAVALSGGKDSSALLWFMKNLTAQRKDITLSAITVDEGIGGYRDPSLAVRIAKSLGTGCLVASFQDEYGVTVDEIVAKKGDSCSCSYCGVLRRSLINRIAREHGVTKLALGFNLDDEAQSVLMNVLRGDADRLIRPQRDIDGMVPRIRPFMYIPEREVALYAHLHVEGFERERCPYAHNALRADVRGVLNDYTSRHPSTKYSLVRLGERFGELGGAAGGEIHACEQCGEPCGASCRSCQILQEVLSNAA
jgi:uncharacterized protein (TIGR00269 family)